MKKFVSRQPATTPVSVDQDTLIPEFSEFVDSLPEEESPGTFSTSRRARGAGVSNLQLLPMS